MLQVIADCVYKVDWSTLELDKLVVSSLTEMILPSGAAEMETRLETIFPNVNISFE